MWRGKNEVVKSGVDKRITKDEYKERISRWYSGSIETKQGTVGDSEEGELNIFIFQNISISVWGLCPCWIVYWTNSLHCHWS